MQVDLYKTYKFYSQQADIETSSEDYARRFSGIIGKYFLDIQAKITLDLLTKTSCKTVLDVGGGHAQLAVPLVKNNYDVTIVGSNANCRDRLDKFLKPGTFTFETGNLLSLPFNDKSFDVVTCFRLLTHEENWQTQISELCRVARFAVIVDYPDIRSFNILYKYFFNAKKKYEGNTRTFRNFRRRELAAEFMKNGFGMPMFKPEFFLPMVLHRAAGNLKITTYCEKIFRVLGFTKLFGSPVILKAEFLESSIFDKGNN